ncbi:FliI/YscN family ATPase [Rhodobacteraceae bacterium]|nr:FliI/YscN family ATPase [Paracoccaceae bacterium]
MDQISQDISTSPFLGSVGRVSRISGPILTVRGLEHDVSIGDRVRVYCESDAIKHGQVIAINAQDCLVFCDVQTDGIKLGHFVRHMARPVLYPCDEWVGHVLDPFGNSLWGEPVMKGERPYDLRSSPPMGRRGLGPRLNTGFAVLNTALPLVQGQRVGIFAGSGVGKSTFLGQLAQNLDTDVIVMALVGERSREVRAFAQDILGPKGMARCVIVAATSDMPATYRYQAALSAMTIAEYFRDQGKSVAFFVDSITRFAEAHREIAAFMGELPVLRGYPASLTQQITALCERAGPGSGTQGDITAVFSVLVAGSDMDEPVADIIRGVLDGHIILDRKIAERGRFPAIDLTRSVSRSLPNAASAEENEAIQKMRSAIALYEKSETMIQAGFYAAGQDPMLDHAVDLYPHLDAFIGQIETGTCADSFQKLRLLFRKARSVKTSAM